MVGLFVCQKGGDGLLGILINVDSLFRRLKGNFDFDSIIIHRSSSFLWYSRIPESIPEEYLSLPVLSFRFHFSGPRTIYIDVL